MQSQTNKHQLCLKKEIFSAAKIECKNEEILHTIASIINVQMNMLVDAWMYEFNNNRKFSIVNIYL